MPEEISNRVQVLIKRRTFRVILREELFNGANVLTACSLLTIKPDADEEVKYNMLYAIGGYRDRLKTISDEWSANAAGIIRTPIAHACGDFRI